MPSSPFAVVRSFPLAWDIPLPHALASAWHLPGSCLRFLNPAWTRCRRNSSPSLQVCSPDQLGVLISAYWGLQPWPGPLGLVAGQCEPNEAEGPNRCPPVCLSAGGLVSSMCRQISNLFIHPAFCLHSLNTAGSPKWFQTEQKEPCPHQSMSEMASQACK